LIKTEGKSQEIRGREGRGQHPDRCERMTGVLMKKKEAPKGRQKGEASTDKRGNGGYQKKERFPSKSKGNFRRGGVRYSLGRKQIANENEGLVKIPSHCLQEQIKDIVAKRQKEGAPGGEEDLPLWEDHLRRPVGIIWGKKKKRFYLLSVCSGGIRQQGSEGG